MDNLKSFISTILFITLYLVSLLPMGLLYLLSDLAFLIGYYVIGYRKAVVIDNLKRSFPEKTEDEIKELSKKFTRHLFSIFAEMLKSCSASKKFLQKRITINNIELINRYYDEDKNVVLVMGHYGNWELLNILPIYMKHPTYAIYKKQRSEILNQLGVRVRNRFGMNLLPSKESVHFILRNKANPSTYLFIADQYPAGKVTKYYTFLNQPTTAFAGADKISKSIGAAVVYLEIMPTERRGYTCLSFTDIPPAEDVTGSFLKLLEKTILKAPQYWLWSHRRWKYKVDFQNLEKCD